MEKAKIDRINFLYKKSKSEGLTQAELVEQATLRQEYRDSFTRDLSSQLDNISFVEPDGSITDIKKNS